MKKMSRMKRKRKRKRRPRLKLRNKKIKRRKKRPSSVCWKSWCFGARAWKGAKAAIKGVVYKS